MPGFLRGTLGWVVAYVANPDPRVAGCNFTALLVVSNQPFYPLYVYWSVSPNIAPSLLTFLSTPFFAAVPAVSRRWPVAGRALLPLTGIANVVVSAKAFGLASGVPMFLIPCTLIAAAFLRPDERRLAIAVIGFALGVYLALEAWPPAPLHLYAPAEYAAFVRLNALSVGGLTVLIGLILSRLAA
jgi:hypothetical protein